jgi:hypothetical protein
VEEQDGVVRFCGFAGYYGELVAVAGWDCELECCAAACDEEHATQHRALSIIGGRAGLRTYIESLCRARGRFSSGLAKKLVCNTLSPSGLKADTETGDLVYLQQGQPSQSCQNMAITQLIALACAAAPVTSLVAPRSATVKTCVEINQCVGCRRVDGVENAP